MGCRFDYDWTQVIVTTRCENHAPSKHRLVPNPSDYYDLEMVFTGSRGAIAAREKAASPSNY
jgi:hypothetical protein